MKSTIIKAFGGILIFTILCGGIYPLVVTGIAQVAFHDKANGSIIEVDGKKYGSELLAPQFTGDEYLWGRPMSLNTTTFYDDKGNPLLYAGPSNKTPANEDYQKVIEARVEKLREAHPDQDLKAIPVDLVTMSGSGLDPDISPAAAAYQISRIAEKRGMDPRQVEQIVSKYTTDKFLGVFGEKRVNVLQVNLALDGILE